MGSHHYIAGPPPTNIGAWSPERPFLLSTKPNNTFKHNRRPTRRPSNSFRTILFYQKVSPLRSSSTPLLVRRWLLRIHLHLLRSYSTLMVSPRCFTALISLLLQRQKMSIGRI